MWHYLDKPFSSADIGNHVGFVYLITDRQNGMKYIGRKVFFNTTKLPPLKGSKRKRTKVTESDWQSYYGSCKAIQAIIAVDGVERFRRDILHLCRSKAEAAYIEAKLQFEHDVLVSDDWYNDMIMVRVSGSHMRALGA